MERGDGGVWRVGRVELVREGRLLELIVLELKAEVKARARMRMRWWGFLVGVQQRCVRTCSVGTAVCEVGQGHGGCKGGHNNDFTFSLT